MTTCKQWSNTPNIIPQTNNTCTHAHKHTSTHTDMQTHLPSLRLLHHNFSVTATTVTGRGVHFGLHSCQRNKNTYLQHTSHRATSQHQAQQTLRCSVLTDAGLLLSLYLQSSLLLRRWLLGLYSYSDTGPLLKDGPANRVPCGMRRVVQCDKHVF